MSSMEQHLPSDKVGPCIDLVDSLRYYLEVEQDMVLPAVAVIGEKSSGKSSVLEALSGVELPRGRQYTLVLRMKKAKGNEWHRMIKSKKYSGSEFEEKVIHYHKDVQRTISDITSWRFSISGLIILEITSPDVPDLTLVDLPSIPSLADTKSQTVDEIKKHIRNFIKNTECIILTVMPCNMEIATSDALVMAKEMDPDGQRTLGLLTKPDIVAKDKESSIVDTVENKVFNLEKGFMIVRCFDQSKVPLIHSKQKELDFFKDHTLFKSLNDGGYATLPKLAERLSQELAQSIVKNLPKLKDYVKIELHHVNTALQRCGNAPPSDESEKLAFLTDKITTFAQAVVKLTTGELLELIDQKAFSVWRKFMKDSEESLLCKLEAEATLNDQSWFSAFQTFDHQEQIKLLEGPALFALSTSTEIVKKELLKLIGRDFEEFSTLISTTESAISDVISRNQKAAESLIRTQFNMEQLEIQAELTICSNKKRDKKRTTTAQLYSYYQTVYQRLTSQIQMIVRFHLLKETSTELQKKMWQTLDPANTSSLLSYDYNLNKLWEKTKRRFIPLTEAQMLLSEL